MKRFFLILSALILILSYWSCRKNENFTSSLKSQDPFVSSALKYLQTQISNEEFRSLNIEGLKILKSEGINQGMIIPSKEESGNSVILQMDHNVFTGNWLRFSINGTPDNGLINTKSFDGGLNNEVTFLHNRPVKLTKVYNGKTTITYIKYPSENTLKGTAKYSTTEISMGVQRTETSDPVYTLMPDISVSVSLNNNTTTFYSVYWITNQNPTNFYNYTPTPPTGGGGGGSTGSSGYVSAPTFISPTHPVLNISDEMKCFSNIAGSTYSITVYVNQPRPGSRDLVNLGSPEPVGHTYLTFEQDNANGTKIIRSVGFYPVDFAKPGHASDGSIFGDDSNTPASVSLKITVSGSDFNTVVQKTKGENSKTYNLDWFNCTTEGIDALSSINIHLPATIRNNNAIAPFTGNDPGDLGEDIKALNLTTFSQQNGNRAMVRNSSNTANSLKPAARTGTCP